LTSLSHTVKVKALSIHKNMAKKKVKQSLRKVVRGAIKKLKRRVKAA